MDIPILGALFRHEVLEKKRSKLYLFVRPIILDDEKFEDLSQISDAKRKEAEEAGLPGSSEQEIETAQPAKNEEKNK
jgi:type II secretory pathway component GspD/PulD (secretin)